MKKEVGMMKYSIGIFFMLLLGACSMSSNQNNSIRIIKEQPKKPLVYQKSYNTKIEKVEYNSFTITSETLLEKQGNKDDDSKIIKQVSSGVESKVSSGVSQAERSVDNLIDKGTSSIFK